MQTLKLDNNIRIPSQSETLTLASLVIKKYQNQDIDADDPPVELLLAKGVLAMYGQIILKRAKQKYGLPKKYLKIAIDLGMRFPELENDA